MRDRLPSGLFSAALVLAEPQLILRALAPNWIMALVLAYFAVKALRKVFEPGAVAVIDSEGIAAPEIWLGTVRWENLDDIRLDRTAPIGRLQKRIQCLAFVFREGLSAPQRVVPSRKFDEHLALGTFLLMPSWIGFSLEDAVRGLKIRLERYQGARRIDCA